MDQRKPEMITSKEAAAELRVTERTIRNWAKAGLIAVWRRAHTVRYSRSEVVQMIERVEWGDRPTKHDPSMG